ncbi:MAG TPA: hypothetical protein VIF08_00150 [Candidatus Limnocylindrales bacterium]|jgi:DNA-binding beta-propeller fold protein YncE
MTDIALTPDLDQSLPADAGTAPPDALGPEDRRRRRRRLAILAVLSVLAVVLLVFSGWYLLFRKPISLLPIPGFDLPPMPGYSYSLYGMGQPTGIAVTPDGSRIYVTQTSGEDAVLMLDGQGQVMAALQSPDTTTDHVFVYIAINPLTAEVYVSDRPAADVLVFAADGTFLRTFEPPASLVGWQPLGLNFTPDGHLLVTDLGANAVYEFDTAGQLLRTIGSNGMFNYPNAAAEDALGRLYVSDSNNGRLVVFGRTGELLGVIRRGPAAGDLGMPRGLEIDDQGRLYVVDNTDHSIKVYRTSADPVALPEFLGSFGEPGIGEGMFRFPNAVATDTRGRLYVADWNNDRVQVWTY